MLKLIATAAIAAVVSTTAAFANPAWTTQDLNFRYGPGSGYHIIASLPYCAQIHVYERYGSWYKASYHGVYGYVSARYVSGSDDHCYYQPKPKYKRHYKSYSYGY